MSRRESQAGMNGHQRLPLLRMATVEDLETCMEYKSGACYKGQILDNKKTGRGVFTWPNGAKYDGEFCENSRMGKGTQTFEDGTVFCGDFDNDLRHGTGHITWPNGESYEGTFFKDRRHGYGTYKWPNQSSYTGTFYVDRKEGYGTFIFPDGSNFQGLYKGDERFGPGVHTHADQSQDVGLWHREKLIRLCENVTGAFTMANHSEFEYSLEDQKMYIYPEYLQNRTDVIDHIVNPPEQFKYPPEVDIKEKSEEQIFSEALDIRSLAVDIRAFDEAFFDQALQSRLSHRKSVTSKKSLASAKSNVSSAKSRKSSKSVRISLDNVQLNSTVSGTINATVSGTINAKSVSGTINAKSVSGTINATVSEPMRSKPSSAISQRSQSAKSAVSTVIDDDGNDEDDAVLAWNKSPLCVVMQKHVLRHKPSEKNVELDLENICLGDRSGFNDAGPMERDSRDFLHTAMDGNFNHVSDLLIQGRVHVDVADAQGHTALLGAAVNWHEDIINCLLDSGADVNKLNDEGVSALAACHVHFYCVDRFKYNIAEKEKDPPSDIEREPGYHVYKLKGQTIAHRRTASEERKHRTHEQRLKNRKIRQLRLEYSNAQKFKDATAAKDEEVPALWTKEDPKQLGTLKFKRAVRINVDDILTIDNSEPLDSDRDSMMYSGRYTEFDSDDDRSSLDEFASQASVRNFRIQVSDDLIERCATALSTNEMVVGRARSAKTDPSSMGTVRRLAIDKNMHMVMEDTIRLLLRRGADPNAANVPMPVLFFAVKAGDVDAVKLLLLKGASTKASLPDKKGCLSPLHIAVALPGDDGVLITELLLNSLADPDTRALPDDSFLNTNLEDEWRKDVITQASRAISGGRTPLHIACARDDNYKNACKVVHLLLDHHANPNLICNGHSPMALAVASGNDLAIDELLAYRADPCLQLTHGVGSVLCIASSTEYELRRTPDNRLKLIDKLVRAGADILAPIPIGPKRIIGTAVDYSYYMYNLDRRIAHMPYHALTHAERETYNNRKKLLAHMGDILRTKAVERERLRLIEEMERGDMSRSPSPRFTYMGAGQALPPGLVKSQRIAGRAVPQEGKVCFNTRHREEGDFRKPLFKYCYECGRSVFVRLSACTRCKEVYYCSKVCKIKAWNARHKEECIRLGGESPDKLKGVASPTPHTDADKGKPSTVVDIINSHDQRIKLPHLSAAAAPNVFSKPGENRGGARLQQAPVGSRVVPRGVPYSRNAPNNRALAPGKGAKLEFIGSLKVNGALRLDGPMRGPNGGLRLDGPMRGPNGGLRLDGPMRGAFQVPVKGRSVSAGRVVIDPVTGLPRTDPYTGRVLYLDNYSFV